MSEIDLQNTILSDGDFNASDFSFLSKIKNEAQNWQEKEHEGQLTVDVVDNGEELLVIAPMAGARVEDISLHLHNDLLTIRGKRLSPAGELANNFCQECYWGSFSRTIVLPTDVKADAVHSEYRSGVLVIRLPKVKTVTPIPIVVIEE